MALPGKERFKITGLKQEISLGKKGEPDTFIFRDKVLTVLGLSLRNDLVPKDIPENIMVTGFARQYIATDKKGNIYDCYIYSENVDGTVKSFIGAIKSIPEK